MKCELLNKSKVKKSELVNFVVANCNMDDGIANSMTIKELKSFIELYDENSNNDIVIESQDEEEIKIEILAKFNELVTRIEELEKENKILANELEHSNRKNTRLNDSIVELANEIAYTSDEKLLWINSKICEFIKTNAIKSDKQIVEMNSIILANRFKSIEEQRMIEALEIKQQMEEYNLYNYDGNLISYKNGELIKNKSCRKSDFNDIKEWFDDVVESLDYIVDNHKTKSGKKFIKEWIKAYNDTFVDENVSILVSEFVEDAINGTDKQTIYVKFAKLFDENWL